MAHRSMEARAPTAYEVPSNPQIVAVPSLFELCVVYVAEHMAADVGPTAQSKSPLSGPIALNLPVPIRRQSSNPRTSRSRVRLPQIDQATHQRTQRFTEVESLARFESTVFSIQRVSSVW